MKTARWLLVVVCVFNAQMAFGQYKNGVPPVYLPEGAKNVYEVGKLKSNSWTNVTNTPVSNRMTADGAIDNVSPVASTGAACCGDGCNQPCCRQVGQSFFRGGGCGSDCRTGSGKIRFSVNRGPQTCNQCGADNRTLLQRILPVSISMRSNHESCYTGIFGGYHDMQDIRAVDRLLDFDDSFILGFTRGRRFCGRIRLESEFAIRDAPAGDYFEGSFVGEDFVPTATYDGEDGFTILTSMRNVLFDFNRCGQLQPYVGLGLGGALVTGDYINDAIGRADWINDVAFSYQFIIGATRRLRGTNNDAYVEFRHFGTSGLELENDAGDPVTDFALQNNTVVFGLRFNRPARNCGCN